MAAAPSIPAVYMRGGTSKGVFLHAADLPPAGPERDRVLLALMGSPDPMQIDGMGGTFTSTSKVMVVEPGPDDAVTYWFAQIGIDTAVVDWSGNCGNLTTAVGPFAIDEGLVAAPGPVTTVRLVNGNTGVQIEAVVHTPHGRAATTGGLAIAGVPGSGSPVTTNYLNPSGGVLGALLPLGAAACEVETPDGPVTVSLLDAVHPTVFVRGRDVGFAWRGRTVAELNADGEFLARIERLRASVAVRAGAAPDIASATALSPAVPRIVLIAPGGDDAEITVLAFSMGTVHRGLPMTGALCLAAAAATDGTVVAEAVGGRREGVRIRHPLGVTEARAERGAGAHPIRSLGVVRTARRLMDGRVYPREQA
jgi:2-methylaconitate isomerase